MRSSDKAAPRGSAAYLQSIRAAARGLWRGTFGIDHFLNAMFISIDRYFPRAWAEGAARCGLRPEEMTQEEKLAFRIR